MPGLNKLFPNLVRGKKHDRIWSYIGSALCAYISGCGILEAIDEEKIAKETEEAVKKFPPKEDGEVTYTAITCTNDDSLQQATLPTDGKSVLIGRIRIKETTNVRVLSDDDVRTTVLGFPKKALLTSKVGAIVAYNLHIAKWYDAEKEKSWHSPAEATLLLSNLRQPVNQTAEVYSITRQWYPKGEVTIFADVTKKGDRYEINYPREKRPFIVTKLNPKAFVEQTCDKAKSSKGVGKFFAISAAVLGIGAFAAQNMEND